MGDAGPGPTVDDLGVLLLVLIVIGMAAGWMAHLLVGDRRRNSWAEDLVVGLVGSLATGLVVSLIAGDGLHLRFTGIFGSVAGAVLVLSIWQLVTSNRKPRPATHGANRKPRPATQGARRRRR